VNAAVKRLREALPDDVLLVLDAAYAEYVRRNDYEAGIELVATTPNTVMTRTFSKIYGLAYLRIGWAYCPAEVADVLNRIRGPFNVSGPAIAAGVAALGDQAWVQRAVEHNETWRARMADALSAIGLGVTPSAANPRSASMTCRVVPWIGGLLSDPAAYRYLPRSVAYLPEPLQMVDRLRQAGFTPVERRLLSGGITQLLLATRQ